MIFDLVLFIEFRTYILIIIIKYRLSWKLNKNNSFLTY